MKLFSTIRIIMSFFLVGLFLLTGCNNDSKFTVEGNIVNAPGKTVYLQMNDVDKNTVLDSCKLDDKGRFSFSQVRPEYPQFYALKLNNQYIFFSIDSTETVNIQADAENFARKYDVSGSENSQKIKELGLLQYDAQNKVNDILKSKEAKDSIDKQIRAVLDYYKKEAIAYILSGHNSIKSPAAYFALFQRINNYLIFDPYDAKDNKIFAAVATAYDITYPNSARSKHLKNLTLQAMNTIRPRVVEKEITAEYSGSIEISLPNEKGEMIKLSSMRGKVVLLDFTIYEADFSPAHNMELREIYNKYKDNGFEIYQVSLDPNENFWKVSASNLPWICVRDKDLQYSEYISLYNITELPTFYLIDRKGELIKRNSQIKSTEEEIKKLL